MKMSVFFELFLAIIIGLIGRTVCFLSVPESKYVTLNHNKITCSKNMACKYMICLWERTANINEDKCTILDNHCSCPEDKVCTITDNVTPGSAILSFQYRCQDPVRLFDSRVAQRRFRSRSRPRSRQQYRRFPYSNISERK